MTHVVNTLTIKNPKMVHKNFSGVISRFNPKGLRSFGILLDDKRAEYFKDLGLQVNWYTNKKLQKKVPYLKVFVNYKYFTSPIVTIGTESSSKYLNDKTINILDHVEMQECNLLIRLYTPKSSKHNQSERYRVAYLGVLDVNDFIELDFTECENTSQTSTDFIKEDKDVDMNNEIQEDL